MTWRILKVTPRQERWTAEHLRDDKGIEAYCPVEAWSVFRNKRRLRRTRPLLPGYIFANIRDDDAHHEAMSLRPVREVWRKAPALFIGSLVLLEADFQFDATWRRPKPAGRYKHAHQLGDAVRVTDGPFEGFNGTVTKVRGSKRLEVLLTIFGRATNVVVEDDALEGLDVDRALAA